jgi:hypothetical protein
MDKHNVTTLEGKIKELIGSLARLASTGEGHTGASAASGDLQELLTIIHRPGWTTPAEATFVEGIVDSMTSNARTLDALKQVLLMGSRAVGSTSKSAT